MPFFEHIPWVDAGDDLTSVVLTNTKRLGKDGALWLKKSGSVPSSNTNLYRPGPAGSYWQREFTPTDSSMLAGGTTIQSDLGWDLPLVHTLVGTPYIGLRNLAVGIDYVGQGNSNATAPIATPTSTYSQVGMRNGTGSTETGTSYVTTGYNATVNASAFVWGSKQVNLFGRTIIPEETNSTNTFEADYGAGNGLSTISSGAYIRYRLNGSTVVYETVTRNGSGGETVSTLTSLPVNTEFGYYVAVAKDLSSAKFYINGTLVQTHTTNLPVAGTPFNFLAGTSKRVGVSARYVIHTQYYPLLTH